MRFHLPKGDKGDKGDSGDIASITSTGSYTAITNLETDANDPHQLLVTYGGIPASDITSGTLGVANGGTGKATHTQNAILTGNGTNALNNIATADGAFYATAANGTPQFGTLPIAEGGTGLTSSPSLLVDLNSTTAENILASAPRPGVTGTLGIANGGTGATTSADAITNLGLDTVIENEVDEVIVIDDTQPTSQKTKI